MKLAAKVTTEIPIAANDVAYEMLCADPTMNQFNIRSEQTVLTAAGNNAAQGAEIIVENTNKDWINSKWRPMMGWMYLAVCITDFIIFPILWSLLQAYMKGQVTNQWQPLTLQGAGLFHIEMGAILGIAVYGRTKEKLEGIISNK